MQEEKYEMNWSDIKSRIHTWYIKTFKAVVITDYYIFTKDGRYIAIYNKVDDMPLSEVRFI